MGGSPDFPELDALVRNAADPKQIKNADRKEKKARELELTDLRELLKTEVGRRFVWRVLGYCRLFSDLWAPGDRMHFNAGLQHVGTWLCAEVTAADDEAFFVMMRESQARAKKDQLDAQALRTKAVTAGDTDDDSGNH